MNYIGSKKRLAPFILQTIQEEVGPLTSKSFCDLFSGTGVIAQTFKSHVDHLIVNDIETYSTVRNRHYIENTQTNHLQEHIRILNSLKGKKGFIYDHYCLGGSNHRQYFSDENGQKIDAIRDQIEAWRPTLSPTDYNTLLTSLLEAADKISNTASVYASFLKTLKKPATRTIELKLPKIIPGICSTEIHQKDANQLIQELTGDILYLDPPYNNRQYGSYYHILNTIAEYTPFTPKGKTGIRPYFKSDYCTPKRVKETFDHLIENANFNTIFLSYNNEGIMSQDFIENTMSKYGTYKLIQKRHKRFKADSHTNRKLKRRKKTTEYLHILTK